MSINEFITENYVYIKAIATNEYNKEKNKILYKQYATDDFINEVMLFFIKKYSFSDLVRLFNHARSVFYYLHFIRFY